MTHPFFSRLDNFKQRLANKAFDTFVVAIPENRYYLSGFDADDAGPQESAGYLIIGEKGQFLLTDSRYELQAQNQASLFQVLIYKNDISNTLPDVFYELKTEILGFESNYLNYDTHMKLQDALRKVNFNSSTLPIKDFVEKQRMIKDKDEVAAIEASIRLTESVLSQVWNQIEDGKSEKEIAWLLEKGMREAGAEKVAFDPIVASGPNSSIPHAKPSDRIISNGDAVVIDLGSRLNNYCSDMTRTFLVGKVPDKVINLYQTVKEAQLLAEDSIIPGKTGKEIDEVAREYISKKGYGEFFSHGLGHGVGLAVHEKPGLNKKGEISLEPGMVITVEPGIYLPQIAGVRLEDMVLITEESRRVMSKPDFFYSF